VLNYFCVQVQGVRTKAYKLGKNSLIISIPSLSVHYEDLTRAIVLEVMKIIKEQLVGQ
jgi:hypothetical protein